METPLPIQVDSNKQPLISLSELFKKSWETFVSHPFLFFGVFAPGLIASVFSSYFPVAFWIQLIAVGVSLWAGLALLYAIKERDQGISITQALQKGTRGFLLYAWILILSFFVSWGGFMLFIVPGVLLGIWFYFAQYVFVDEKGRGLNALLYSKDLVSGYTWQVFIRLLAPVLLGVAVIIPAMLLLETTGIGRPWFTADPEIAKQTFFVGDTIISSLGFIFEIFFSIFGFLLYENIKLVKGNPSFEIPTRKRKIKYLAVGFGGVLLVPILISLAAVFILIVQAILSSLGGSNVY